MTKEQQFLKVWNSPYLFAKNFIKIVDKNGNLVPFNFNEVQQDFISNTQKYNIILKSRQLGMSVCILALSIHRCITQPNSTCLLLSHTDESTRAVFSKLKQMFNSIPDCLKPKLKTNNRQELEMVNGSIIRCATMSKRDKGRGSTLNLIHLSEFAFVDSETAQKQLLSLEQALSSDGKLIIETTANGMNFFSEMYFKSKSQENAYKSFFYNYVDGSCMFKEQYEETNKIFRNINGHKFGMDDLTDEERELLEQDKNMTLDILCWRRLKIQNVGLDQFNQEYPYSDDLAFLSTGTNVFDKKVIADNKMRVKSVKALDKGILDISNILQPYCGSSLWIYKKVIKGSRYVISNDCSEGIGSDYHVSCVIDCETMEQVALFRNNKIRPDQFAQVVNELGRYYNNAYCIVELASGGHTVLEKLFYTYKYYNIHRHRTYDKYGKSVDKLGFDTNAQTKGMAISSFREMFEKNNILINSEVILDEMLTYEFKDGKYNAKSGSHDDTIMCMAIASEVMKKPIRWKVM